MTIPIVWLPIIPAILFFVFACGYWYGAHRCMKTMMKIVDEFVENKEDK